MSACTDCLLKAFTEDHSLDTIADDGQVYCKEQCDISGTEQVYVHRCFSCREQPKEEQEEYRQNDKETDSSKQERNQNGFLLKSTFAEMTQQ